MKLFEVELLREFHSYQAAEDGETLLEQLQAEDDRFRWMESTITPIEVEGFTINVTPDAQEGEEAPRSRGGRRKAV